MPGVDHHSSTSEKLIDRIELDIDPLELSPRSIIRVHFLKIVTLFGILVLESFPGHPHFSFQNEILDPNSARSDFIKIEVIN